MGAIDKVTWRSNEGYINIIETLDRLTPGCDGLVPFNDAKGRTQADVLALIDQALATA